ncbi:fanconi-associated nuclease 1 homolog isoform X2 [Telopea speciosissima]|uniref:fanconi-associated nuclease 1 homolog isoform X2 n=1 Tax=Telopea speciosissima TaxID=54955 RepID=UPI001CC79C3D|nr:fanconi-associated nuclease 1 homolog isoform X2 [Telopea speciosissima]
MLTGRESLVRLIGKRRRFLPNCQSLFPSYSAGSSNPQEENGEVPSCSGKGPSKYEMDIRGNGEAGRSGGMVSDLGWVNCPVCGDKLRATDYNINSHLDTCLARGTKRKLTQRTLLESRFCSRSKDKVHSDDSSNLGSNSTHRDLENSPACNTSSTLPEFGATEADKRNQCLLPLDLSFNRETCIEVLVENLPKEGSFDKVDEPPPFSHDLEMHQLNMVSFKDNISGATLETFIVGRRFSDEVELKQGASISLSRDSNNPKDPNAIKVFSMDSESGKMLGFLPRELAQYLSPLIEKYRVNFEGFVISLPKHSFDAVPIQIVCHEIVSRGEKESNDCQCFESLWENVVRVVEYAKKFPTSMTRYQQNFCIIIHEVLDTYSHLFLDEEKLFLESFSSLSDDSQRLLVRLYTRKGPWFRISNISYAEILDCQEAIKGLCAAGYIYSLESTKEMNFRDMKEVLDVLVVSELREISSLTHLKGGVRCTKKQDFIAWILASYEDGMCPLLPSLILDRTGTCIRITSTAELLLWRVERLFFLNGQQDLSAFLLVNLGLVKYPSYKCITMNQIFPGRSDLLEYEEAVEVAQIMDQSLDENNIEVVMRCIEISEAHISSSSDEVAQSSISESVGTFLSRYSALWIYSKVVTLGISFLECDHKYQDAIRLLKQLLSAITCDGRRGYWTLRLSVDLEHVGCVCESLLVAEEGLLDPWVRAGSKMALQRRVLRLGKPPRRWKTPSFADSVKRKIKEVHIQGRPLNCETGMRNRYYGEDGEQCGVEQLALQYYAGDGGGWQGVHAESGIWMMIFGLLMWDVIFADVPDVFRTRFQTAPLDLETDNFYIARKNLIESHLQKIQDGMAEEILITSWESHVETACRGVNWERHTLSELRAAVTCIGGHCLASFCRHLSLDYRSWSSGMPDLLLWRFCGEYTGEAKLVEVKGPRDRLSEQQRAWLLLLMDCGFNTEVCKVSPDP